VTTTKSITRQNTIDFYSIEQRVLHWFLQLQFSIQTADVAVSSHRTIRSVRPTYPTAFITTY